jgi:hypothetical protein
MNKQGNRKKKDFINSEEQGGSMVVTTTKEVVLAFDDGDNDGESATMEAVFASGEQGGSMEVK